MAKNICNCPNPPGGTVRCEAHQMAVCAVINGEAHYRCLDPPKGIVDSVGLATWAIQEIAGVKKRTPGFTLNLDDELNILASGKYSSGEIRINFNLPENIKKAVEELRKR